MTTGVWFLVCLGFVIFIAFSLVTASEPWNVTPTAEFRTRVTWTGAYILEQKFTGRACGDEIMGVCDVYMWRPVQRLL